ncbi:MAG: 2TM domain-containing protein [bacterium]
MSEGNDARVAAEHRLKAQAGFKRNAATFVIIAIGVTVIWALTGKGEFWPVWVYLGLGLGIAFSAYGAYGPREKGISQADIDAEAKKFEEK